MKKIIYTLLSIFILVACGDNQDKTTTVNGWSAEQALRFEPIAGGSVMHYILPDDPDIVGLNVRYQDAQGNSILRTGSNVCDSLSLIGFNEAQDKVEAQVSLCFRDNTESQPFDITFRTNDSGPVSFIKSVKVIPNWGGFTLKFKNPANTTGMAHVFYVGVDPLSNKTDTILMNSFLLTESDDVEVLNYKIAQDVEDLTVVIKSEDFRGYQVSEVVFSDVNILQMGKLNANDFTFFCDNSVEDSNDMLGVQYLFDGDTKGLLQWENPALERKCCSFLAGPNAAGEDAHPMYFDLKKNRIMASVRLYTMLYSTKGPQWYGGTSQYIVYIINENELPNEVTIYALKDNGVTPATYEDINNMEGWEQVGKFKQDKTIEYKKRWCQQVWSSYYISPYTSLKEMQEAPEEFMDITIPADGQKEGYRYLKMVINDVFDMYYDYGSRNYYNLYKYVQFHELEVYTDKK